MTERNKKNVNWLNDAQNCSWLNYSVPSHDGCDEKTKIGLKRCLTRQMSPAQGVIILAGMYAAHSDWIEYEVEEALRMGKTIIGLRPWGQERTSAIVKNAATRMVNWNSASLVQAVRDIV